MLTKGNKYECLDNPEGACSDFLTLTKELNLKLSGKGAVLAKNQTTAVAMQVRLKKIGMDYQQLVHTRDVGAGFSFISKHRKTLVRNRAVKTKPALKEIAQIAKISKLAKKLFAAAGYSKSTWGQRIHHFSKFALLQLERQAHVSTGHKKGTCRYVVLCIAYGTNGHPVVRLYRELVVEWFKMVGPEIRNGIQFYDDMQLSWLAKFKQIRLACQSWALH